MKRTNISEWLFVNHLDSTLCCIVASNGIGNKCMRRNFIICSCHLIFYGDYEGETSFSQAVICTGKYGLLVENTSTRISFGRTRYRGTAVESQPQGHSAAGRIMSLKNSIDTIGNRTRELSTCSAVPQSTAPPRAPLSYISHCFYMWSYSSI